ncbi:MAG: hypothetical protein EBR82_81770 [Caulobacteraceae bacterium]|nr:hypothetical protein [Caulobacteraceae bacterium]
MNTQKQLSQLYKEHSNGDSWGNAMAMAFALCEVLYLRDENEIPELMRFKPGIGGVVIDEDNILAQTLQDFETSDLEIFGRKINRLLEILKKQGKDY